MIDFSNLQIAFISRSDKELRKAFRLFSLVKNPFLVKTGKIFLHFALFIHFPIKWMVKPTIFSHFCGGETIDECSKTIDSLATSGISTILDYSAEGGKTEISFDLVTEEILKTIHNSAGNKNISFCVFKISGVVSMALLEKISSGIALTDQDQKEYANFYNRVDKLCMTAEKSGKPIFIDAEESWTQDPIDDICEKMADKYNKKKAVVFNTLQMYRTDRINYLKKEILRSVEKNIFCGFKLVRGAYLEKERKRALNNNYQSPVFDTKQQTDESYNSAIKICMQNLNTVSVCVATHNESSTMFSVNMSLEMGLKPDDKRLSFAQLMGMSDHISFNLAHSGFNVSKYVPYGPIKKVMPYLIRRAEENTSIAGQTLRELSLIKEEILNRKKKTHIH